MSHKEMSKRMLFNLVFAILGALIAWALENASEGIEALLVFGAMVFSAFVIVNLAPLFRISATYDETPAKPAIGKIPGLDFEFSEVDCANCQRPVRFPYKPEDISEHFLKTVSCPHCGQIIGGAK